MWEVASCDPYNEAQLEAQLSDGYEPFAVGLLPKWVVEGVRNDRLRW